MKKPVHPLAVSNLMPFRWHRNMAEVALTEELQTLASKGKLTNVCRRQQLERLLERATFPTCRETEPESRA